MSSQQLNESEQPNWDTIGFVTASEYRTQVLSRLGQNPAKPSAIATDTEISIAAASHALSDLCGRDLAELLTPDERKKGRIYGITEKGSQALVEVGRVANIELRDEVDRDPVEIKTNWELIGFVEASRYRQSVLTQLAQSAEEPSIIARNQGINPAHVSRALGELRERDLVELRGPGATDNNRVYGITEQGRAVVGDIQLVGVTDEQ